jgi:hypothetical protein
MSDFTGFSAQEMVEISDFPAKLDEYNKICKREG